MNAVRLHHALGYEVGCEARLHAFDHAVGYEVKCGV